MDQQATQTGVLLTDGTLVLLGGAYLRLERYPGVAGELLQVMPGNSEGKFAETLSRQFDGRKIVIPWSAIAACDQL